MLSAWAAGSKDQFCEIKFAFDTGCAITLFCPPGPLIINDSSFFFVRLWAVWAAQTESISARIRDLNNQCDIFRSQRGMCHAPLLAAVSRYGLPFVFASVCCSVKLDMIARHGGGVGAAIKGVPPSQSPGASFTRFCFFARFLQSLLRVMSAFFARSKLEFLQSLLRVI